ncbi:MAG: UDP-N-acetylmuramoyl-L-alanyl-D-glutamate--2,6-diaminopimelate ligase [Nitrospirae bacterium]|nr:UDP-N-acetylmuramoyl-L-alanyl-D-glutamate--2,6-diaminopimelate ligase [Nitrospirota bacterium]
MILKDLLDVLNKPEVNGGLEVQIGDIAYDSREVKRGSLFVAVKGFKTDGHRYIADAVKRGASAVVAEDAVNISKGDATIIIVPDTRNALALLSARFYGDPSRRLRMIGITGTNGKTTTSYLIKSIIEKAGKKAGLLGTISYIIGNEVMPAPHTTPESSDLQKHLSQILDTGAEYAVMEVSSHALELNRTANCEFDIGVFTNLTQDHLDFHKTMEDYFNAKLKLFTSLNNERGKMAKKVGIINIDDPYSNRILSAMTVKAVTYGFSENADIRPAEINIDIGGIRFAAVTPKGNFPVESRLTGKYNILNMLASIAVGQSLGFDNSAIQEGISSLISVSGRFEKINEGQDFSVVVDYAHTEDALKRILEAIRVFAKGRVITVFGCGGDRDRGKRPKMGEAAVKLSEIVILTSDNPRSEDPHEIIKEIEEGIKRRRNGRLQEYLIIPDRKEAIYRAIGMAEKDDIILLAGKGHEDYQIIGDKKLHFDDREIAREAIIKSLKIV